MQSDLPNDTALGCTLYCRDTVAAPLHYVAKGLHVAQRDTDRSPDRPNLSIIAKGLAQRDTDRVRTGLTYRNGPKVGRMQIRL